MLNIGDKVKVIKDHFNGADLVGKEGTVFTIATDQSAYQVVVLLDDFTPNNIDIMFAQLLGYPIGSMPFEPHELEAI